MGALDIDDLGNIKIKEGNKDNYGRKVNPKGYLVDDKGNIIN